MRTLYFQLKKQFPLIMVGCIALVAASCSSSRSAYESDGIYATESQEVVAEEDSKSSYYKQYFQSKDKTFEEVPEEGAVFTNIEAYSSSESLDEDGNIIIEEPAYAEGYGAWGTNADNVTVNVYNNAGFGWGNGWGIGWGWGWNRPYWGIGWGYGFYNPWVWNAGWGGFYGNPYWYGGFYGWGGFYGNPYFPYYNNYYGGYYNSYAYNRGRRNTDYLYGRNANRGRSNATQGRRSYSRSELDRRINRTNARRSNTRGTNRVNSGRTRTINPNSRGTNRTRSIRSNRSSRPSYSRPNTSRRSNSYSRPSSSSRSGSFSRGGSMRSSGARSGGRSGGRRGGGRG